MSFVPSRLLRLIYYFPNFIKLFWRLLRDKRIPWYKKALPFTGIILSLAYIIFPFDMLPDPFAFIGHFDDATVILLIMIPCAWIFIRSCPKDIVKEHARQIGKGFPL